MTWGIWSIALAMSIEHHDGLGEACTGLQESIELSVFLKLIESTEGGNDVLFRFSFFPVVLDNLQINAFAGFLLPEKHSDTPFMPP